MAEWFVQKRFGYGVSPSGWQGWLATGAMVLLMLLDVVLLRGAPRWLCLAALVAAFVVVLRRHSAGRWGWRWGGER